jgi:hypothetical protein
MGRVIDYLTIKWQVKTKCRHCRTIPKSNIKIVERGKIDTPTTQIYDHLTLSSLAFYNNWNLKKSQLIRRKKEMRLVNICDISVSLHCVVLETLSILTLFNSTESIAQCHACSNSTYSYWILIFKHSYLSKRLSEAINTLHFWLGTCISVKSGGVKHIFIDRHFPC